MCGDVVRGVWLHAGGIGESNITPVIGQLDTVIDCFLARRSRRVGRWRQNQPQMRVIKRQTPTANCVAVGAFCLLKGIFINMDYLNSTLKTWPNPYNVFKKTL